MQLLKTLSATALLLILFAPLTAQVADDAPVYYIEGKGRFHAAECRRISGFLKSTPDQVTQLTFKEGTERGLKFCSRCPVDDPNQGSIIVVHEDVKNGQLVFFGEDGKLVYEPYTNKGDTIMDYSHSGYKASEVPIPMIATAVTLEPLPNSPPPVRQPLPEVKQDEDVDMGPMVWFEGKKRFHDASCQRAGGSIKDSPEKWIQISYRQGILSNMDYCSRCPKDAPRVKVDKPDPEDYVPFMAYPDGPDSHERIQAAIDRVGAMEPDSSGFRGAVLLKKGTYYLKGTLTVTSGVVLRGEGDGEDGTVLVFHNPKGAGIVLGNNAQEAETVSSKLEVSPYKTRISDAYVPVGSNSVNVKDASGLKVGDAVNVIKTTNEAWLYSIGMHQSQIKMRRPWEPSAYQLSTPRRIAKIEGNQVTFDVPLAQGYVAEHGGGEIITNPDADNMPALIGVEGLRVVSNYDRKVKSMLRGKAGGYESDEEQNMSSGISMRGVVNSWVRNCTVMHTSRNSFTNKNSQFITFMDCTSLEPISPVRGGRRYCFSNSDSSMVLFYKCSAEYGRHPYVTGSRDPGPIAFVRSKTLGGGSETHSRWATGVLFDNILVTERGGIAAGNRGGGGSGHGWAGANVVMWNCTSPGLKVQNPPTPEQNFAIGSTLTEGSTEVDGDGYVESTGTQVKPDSLFEAQLIERIGEENAEAVLSSRFLP